MSFCSILKIKKASICLCKILNLFVVGRIYRSVFICLSILFLCAAFKQLCLNYNLVMPLEEANFLLILSVFGSKRCHFNYTLDIPTGSRKVNEVFIKLTLMKFPILDSPLHTAASFNLGP